MAAFAEQQAVEVLDNLGDFVLDLDLDFDLDDLDLDLDLDLDDDGDEKPKPEKKKKKPKAVEKPEAKPEYDLKDHFFVQPSIERFVGMKLLPCSGKHGSYFHCSSFGFSTFCSTRFPTF